MRKLLLTGTMLCSLSACMTGVTYLRDGPERMSDGTYGHYAGTCTGGEIGDPTTWFMPPVCFAHTNDGRETVISGHNAAESAGDFLVGVGSTASVIPSTLFAARWRPDQIDVSANAPTSVSGNGPVYAAGGNSSSTSRSQGGNATATGGNATATGGAGGLGGAGGIGGAGGSGGNATASPVANSNSRSNSRSTAAAVSSSRINNTNNNNLTQWQGQCQGRSVSGSNCGDP